MARYYADKGSRVDPERIFITSSTSEAYGFLFRLLVNPGERVAIPNPSYPLLDYLADLCDVSLSHYPLHYDDRWWVDLAALSAQAQVGLKAVVTISPNNPTGSIISGSEWTALQSLAARHGMAVIADEVFLDYAFEEAQGRQSSLSQNNPALTFTLSGVSKVLALPQMKLSWLVVSGPDDIVEQACTRLEMIADTYLSVGTPVQSALSGWMEERQLIQQEIMRRTRGNRDLLQKQFGADSLHTDGGWSSVIRVPDIVSDESLAIDLLERDAVLVDPGRLFGLPDAGYLVVGLLTPVDIFKTGISALARHLEQL